MLQSSGGAFYVDASHETIVDPLLPPVHTHVLLSELRKCDGLVQRDLRYAHLVAGASKMPLGMVWTARNQEDQCIKDTDLAALRDVAWTEFVKKRYLPGLPGTTTVQGAAASMLEIVRDMHLQRRRFQIMGLHEQVEASEIQLILHLCQAEIIRTDNYRATANRYRRHDKLFEAFALAVGAFVCASAPYTMGSGTTRYERDLQFEYKKQTTALFVWALRRVRDAPEDAAMEEDYVARIARLIVVWPDDGTDGRRVGFSSSGGGGNDDSNDSVVRAQLLDAVAEAQRNAEKALVKAVKLESEGRRLEKDVERVQEAVGEKSRDVETRVEGMVNRMEQEVEKAKTLMENKVLRVKNEILEDMGNFTARAIREFNSNDGGFFEQLKKGIIDTFQGDLSRLKNQMSEISSQLDNMKGHESRINELSSRLDMEKINKHEVRIKSLEDFVSADIRYGKIMQVAERQRELELDVASLKEKERTMETEIDRIKQKQEEIYARTRSIHQAAIPAVSSSNTNPYIDRISERLDTLESSIGFINTTVASSNSAIQRSLNIMIESKINAFKTETNFAIENLKDVISEVSSALQSIESSEDAVTHQDFEAFITDFNTYCAKVDEMTSSRMMPQESKQSLTEEDIHVLIDSILEKQLKPDEIKKLFNDKIEEILSPLMQSLNVPAAAAASSSQLNMDLIKDYINAKLNELINAKVQALQNRLDRMSMQTTSDNLDPNVLYGSEPPPENASFRNDGRRTYEPSVDRPPSQTGSRPSSALKRPRSPTDSDIPSPRPRSATPSGGVARP